MGPPRLSFATTNDVLWRYLASADYIARRTWRFRCELFAAYCHSSSPEALSEQVGALYSSLMHDLHERT